MVCFERWCIKAWTDTVLHCLTCRTRVLVQSAERDMSDESPHEGEPSQSTQSTQSPSQALSTQSSQPKAQSQLGSSSSSGPTSGSQSSSGSGTLSSVDTIPVTLPSVPEEPEAEPWGRLLPMARGFRNHGLFVTS